MAPVPPLVEKQRTQFLIQGMSCTACATRVENALLNLDGVETAHVNFATATSLVWHGRELKPSTMSEVVAGLGYQAIEDGDRQQIQSSTIMCDTRITFRNTPRPKAKSFPTDYNTRVSETLSHQETDNEDNDRGSYAPDFSSRSAEETVAAATKPSVESASEDEDDALSYFQKLAEE